MSDEKKDKSPNPSIDKAIKGLMDEISGKNKTKTKNAEGIEELVDHPLDMKVKVINTAINWEKVKHHIRDGEEFDPSAI